MVEYDLLAEANDEVADPHRDELVPGAQGLHPDRGKEDRKHAVQDDDQKD